MLRKLFSGETGLATLLPTDAVAPVLPVLDGPDLADLGDEGQS